MDRSRRIAFYGGTFDPVHRGHLEVATKVLQLFEIDELLFVPAQVAPHKVSRDVTPALHRFAMLALATQDNARLLVSTFELDAPGRCYTVDTLAHFKAELSEPARLFFVMGADSWGEVTSWRDWERFLTMTNHIVVTRPGYDLSVKGLAPSLAQRIVDLRVAAEEGVSEIVNNSAGEKIFITDAVMKDISATAIRRAGGVDAREQLAELVPLPVADYIRKYKLYRDTNGR
jgi:nicotinate-nucleotide adenylyltransferase